MKAAVYTRYGPPEVVRVTQAPKPVASGDEVVVRVRASSVNRTDCGFLRAKPFVVRFFAGLTKPRRTILGCEFAGDVEAVGDGVTSFSVGDRVFGYDDARWGGHAEYKVISEKRMVATIPPAISYEEAAVSTEGAHYALTFVRALRMREGSRVLVHGATGAIGSAAVQLLKHAGVFVIATSDTRNVELVRSLGADAVVDRSRRTSRSSTSESTLSSTRWGRARSERANGCSETAGYTCRPIWARWRRIRRWHSSARCSGRWERNESCSRSRKPIGRSSSS